jgi:hypothetical protein
VGVDRNGAEGVERHDAAEAPPPPPPDRPGAEGFPSRADSRAAAAADHDPRPADEAGDDELDPPAAGSTGEGSGWQADADGEQPSEDSESRHDDPDTGRTDDGTDQQPSPERDARDAGTSSAADTSVGQRTTPDESASLREVDDGSETQARDNLQSELDAETFGEERADAADGAPRSTEFASPAQEAPSERGDGLHDNPDGASAESEVREGDQQTAGTQDAGAGERAVERTDQPHEVRPPQIVCDYYPNIPPTTQDRYLDQSNLVPVFDGLPTRYQAVQGGVGDCGIVATLGTVAERRPDTIKDAIKQVGDGEYEITLHEITEATPADPVARPTGDVKTYRVNDELPVRTDLPSWPPAGVQAESCGWAALMEKVIAAEDQTWDTVKKAGWDQAWTTQHKPTVDQSRANAGLGPSANDAPMGYNRLDIGSTAYQRADLLAKLTGEDAEVRRIPGEQQGEQALLDGFRDQLNAGKPVLVGSRGHHRPSERFPNRIVPGHAYEVTKVENNKIHMHNPWGKRHPDPMDVKTFWEYYRRYNHDGRREGDFTTLK